MGKSMTSMLQKILEIRGKNEALSKRIQLFEHETYKPIPGTKNSYRTDSGNTNTKTIKHSHVYAKLKGGGSELYSVNMDGTGHDGSRGKVLPQSHAEHFRDLGYSINPNNILESMDFEQINESKYSLILIEKV
jgi:hypothetical protein